MEKLVRITVYITKRQKEKYLKKAEKAKVEFGKFIGHVIREKI